MYGDLLPRRRRCPRRKLEALLDRGNVPDDSRASQGEIVTIEDAAREHIPFDHATTMGLYPALLGYSQQVLAVAKGNAFGGFILQDDFTTLVGNATAEAFGQLQSEQIEAQKLGHPPFIY